MQRHTGKLILLIALVGVWAAIFALRQSAPPHARTAPSRSTTGAGRTTGAQDGGLPRLKTELLRPPPAYTPEVHNIFGEPSPPPPPPGTSAAAGAAASAAAAAPPAPPPPPPPDPFLEGAKGFRYVGFLRRGTTMTAFIVEGQHVYTLPVGETLEGRYRVQAITEDTLVLSSASGDKQVRLSLTQEGAPPPAR